MTDYRAFLSEDALTIFLLHGVVSQRRDGVRNYTLKHLDADSFRALCASLASGGTAVSLETGLAMLAEEVALPPRAFVVTFDDGFRNNLTVAAPILADAGIPAAFYCTTGFIESNGASWIDLIEDAIERTSLNRIRLPWDTDPRPVRTIRERIGLLDEVRRVLKETRGLDPYRVAEEIQASARTGEFEPDPDLDQKLTWSEVRELAGSELFTVGGHSHTHRILAYLSEEDLENEIRVSVELLTKALGFAPRHYSYPEGLGHCYSDEVIQALKRHRIASSPTAMPGTNPKGSDPFHLRRIMVDSLPST